MYRSSFIKNVIFGVIVSILLLVLGIQAWTIRSQGYEIISLRNDNIASRADLDALRLKIINMTDKENVNVVPDEEPDEQSDAVPEQKIGPELALYEKRVKEDHELFGDLIMESYYSDHPYYRRKHDNYVRWIEASYKDKTYSLHASFYRSNKQSIIYTDEMITSYKFEDAYFDGAAHDTRDIYVGTINRNPYWNKSRRLTLSDIVSKDQIPKMTELLIESFKKELDKKGWKYKILEDGSLDTGHDLPKPTENFYYAADGLHFVYNEYEIHCYAAGDFDICIDWPLPESVTWRYKGAGTDDRPAVFDD